MITRLRVYWFTGERSYCINTGLRNVNAIKLSEVADQLNHKVYELEL